MATRKSEVTQRPYHHGDLRAALIAAALEIIDAPGVDALSLRTLTEGLGVTPRAAYRHFSSKSDLLRAVGAVALSRLATDIENRLEALSDHGDLANARATLLTFAEAYVSFARTHPGAMQAAFFHRHTLDKQEDPEARGHGGRTIFEMLAQAFRPLHEHGLLVADVPTTALGYWSTVHGYAILATMGPLRERDDDAAAAEVRACLLALLGPALSGSQSCSQPGDGAPSAPAEGFCPRPR